MLTIFSCKVAGQERKKSTVRATPSASRRTLLFSATMPPAIKKITARYLHDPVEVTIKAKAQTAENITQRYIQVAGPRKMDAITRLLEVEPFEAMIVFVRTKHMTEQELAAVSGELKSQVGDFTMPQIESVGPTISKELTANAIKAVLFASLAIVLYLTARFAVYGLAYGFRFGVCAVIALLHDVGIVIGSFAILGKFLGWEIDSLFITALLTIIGFSVHDTIVVFDRIRENLRHRAKGETFDFVANKNNARPLITQARIHLFSFTI